MFTSRRGSPALARSATTLIVLCFFLAACSPSGGLGGGSTTPTAAPTHPTSQAPSATPNGASADTCPQELAQFSHCQTPHSIRVAYGIESLIEHGFTGKGQTVVDIVSFGSPTLQQDIDAYDQQFGLPPIKIQVFSPIPERESDPYGDKAGWGDETTLDVEVIHALAPEAGIVVLTSPVAETEGTFGLPEFRQLVQYTIDHHLGNIISNSWGASEATLNNQAGQQELQRWNTLLQKATTKQGITFFAASGDQGASDFTDMRSTKLAPNPTTAFLADNPWVTSVGGTSLLGKGPNPQEVACGSRLGCSDRFWFAQCGSIAASIDTGTEAVDVPTAWELFLDIARHYQRWVGQVEITCPLIQFNSGPAEPGNSEETSLCRMPLPLLQKQRNVTI